MKLIVGLGNPGPEYADTRHNIGFLVAEELAERYEAGFRNSAKWKARTAKIAGVGDGFVIAEPTTFMNQSGWAVRDLVAFHKIALDDLLVVVDDADLPFGRLRARTGGSAGGHNGLKSIIQDLGTEQFSRLRVGVGRQPGELSNHVLGRFGAAERAELGGIVKKAADAADLFVRDGILKVMNTFNVVEQNQSSEDQA